MTIYTKLLIGYALIFAFAKRAFSTKGTIHKYKHNSIYRKLIIGNNPATMDRTFAKFESQIRST